MASQALEKLLGGIAEVKSLQNANPTPVGNLPSKPEIVRAINRASVVLLSSHLESYIRSVNEAAVEAVNQSSIVGSHLPLELRLNHTRVAIDALASKQWDQRADGLREFISTEAWLWVGVTKAELEHARLLTWLKSPSPERLVTFFKLWGIKNIFTSITRTQHTRNDFWLRLKELVEKRNLIAHGDGTTEATANDISNYVRAVRDFCERSDRALARSVMKITGDSKPW